MIAIMPMAGRGSRFQDSDYHRPKPLIEVLGKPMFIHALQSLAQIPYNQIIFIALEEHETEYGLSTLIKEHVKAESEIVLIPEVTQGQLCTVLCAKKFIDNKEDILIISSDTVVLSSIGTDIKEKPINCKGLISVASMQGDRWSFAKTDVKGRVVEVAEKVRISDHASTGLYYFSNGKEFVERAEKLIASNETTRGEYYIIPLYQKYIEDGDFIGISKAKEMWDMGTPDALEAYLRDKA